MQNEITVIMGMRGHGKSSLAKYLVKNDRRLIIFDPDKQFSSCGVCLYTFDGFKVYTGRAYLNRRPFRAVYQPIIPPIDDEDVLQAKFKEMCGWVYGYYENLTLLVDEIDECIPTTDRGIYFKNIVKRGRHKAISLVATAIRYTDVQRSVTGQAGKIFCFNMHEPSDLEYFRKRIGDIADDLPHLPPYHFIKYEGGKVTRHEPIQIT